MALGSSLGGNAFIGGGGYGGAVNGPSGGYFGSQPSGFGGITSMSSSTGGSGGGMSGWNWGGIIGGAASLIGGLFGMGQRRKANKLAAETQAPEATINPEIAENRAIAQQMAQVGLPQAQYNLALQNIYRNQAGALRTAQTSGRPTNVASILRQSNDAVARLDAQDAAARMANQRTLMGANTALAGERNRLFNWDREQYLMALQQIAGMRQSGTNNLMGALGLLGNVAISGGFKNLFGGSSSSGSSNITGGASFEGVTPNTTVTAPSTLPYQ